MRPRYFFLYDHSMKDNNKLKQIFLDMDGVLADFETTCSKMLGEKVWNNTRGHLLYDDNKRELTARHLFRKLKPYPDAWKLVDWCANSGIPTEILTAAGTVNRQIVIKDKIDWTREYVHPDWLLIPTFKGSQKAAFAHKKAVLIDDRPKNIECWVEAGGIGILHTSAEDTVAKLNEIVNS